MLRTQVGGYDGYRWWPGQEMTGAGTSVGRRKWGGVGTSVPTVCRAFSFSVLRLCSLEPRGSAGMVPVFGT